MKVTEILVRKQPDITLDMWCEAWDQIGYKPLPRYIPESYRTQLLSELSAGSVADRATGRFFTTPEKSVTGKTIGGAGKGVFANRGNVAIKWLKVVKFLGFYPFFQEWQEQRAKIQARTGVSDSDKEAALRQSAEQMVVKIVATSQFANMLKWMLRIPLIGRTMGWMIGITGSVATFGLLGGPAVIEILATEMAAIALERWLTSEAGKKAVGYMVMYAIDPTLTFAWNNGFAPWFGFLKQTDMSADGKKQFSQDLKVDPNVSASDFVKQATSDASKTISSMSATLPAGVVPAGILGNKTGDKSTSTGNKTAIGSTSAEPATSKDATSKDDTSKLTGSALDDFLGVGKNRKDYLGRKLPD
jgi:hypothetical protein